MPTSPRWRPVRRASTRLPTPTPRRPCRFSQVICSAKRGGDTHSGSSASSGAPSAVVVPQLVTPHLATVRALREAIGAVGANASIAEVFNTNALLAEAAHIRLAEAGLARADRVRMFSITTSADGIILVTVGGDEAVGSASVTAVLLAARLALPVIAASLDGTPTVAEAADRLEQMGVTRIAAAPCLVGPEADLAALEAAAAAVGATCAAPLGAHGNVIKLISLAYGHALSQIEALDAP